MNFDGAAKGNPSPIGIGGLIRDSHGKILSHYWGILGSGTINLAELDGLINGVTWVIQNQKTPLIVDGDSMVIINLTKWSDH